jgi:hypothetical protein
VAWRTPAMGLPLLGLMATAMLSTDATDATTQPRGAPQSNDARHSTHSLVSVATRRPSPATARRRPVQHDGKTSRRVAPARAAPLAVVHAGILRTDAELRQELTHQHITARSTRRRAPATQQRSDAERGSGSSSRCPGTTTAHTSDTTSARHIITPGIPCACSQTSHAGSRDGRGGARRGRAWRESCSVL